MKIALDTNGYRLFMEKNETAFHLVRTSENIFLPVPVLAELKYGFLNGSRTKQNEAGLTKFLDSPRPCFHKQILKIDIALEYLLH